MLKYGKVWISLEVKPLNLNQPKLKFDLILLHLKIQILLLHHQDFSTPAFKNFTIKQFQSFSTLFNKSTILGKYLNPQFKVP